MKVSDQYRGLLMRSSATCQHATSAACSISWPLHRSAVCPRRRVRSCKPMVVSLISPYPTIVDNLNFLADPVDRAESMASRNPFNVLELAFVVA